MITEQTKQELLKFMEYLLNEGALCEWTLHEDFAEMIDAYEKDTVKHKVIE